MTDSHGDLMRPAGHEPKDKYTADPTPRKSRGPALLARRMTSVLRACPGRTVDGMRYD
jgi:hypothetical protein